MSFILYNDDCLNVLKRLEDNSIDSICTDPPYGLSDHKPDQVLACLQAWIAGEVYEPKGKGFMGKSWDAWAPGPEIWRECLRVLKPGGHLLAFAGTRSMDLMGMSVRLAGFELRDSIGYANDGGGAPLMAWVTGSGFPKSANISKMIDKAAGVEREVVGVSENVRPDSDRGNGLAHGEYGRVWSETAPATEAAKKWEGFGSALKPAWEPVILARKPLIGTLAANVLEHGTGGLNIDACRISTDDKLGGGHSTSGQQMTGGWERPWMSDPDAVAANIERSKQAVEKAEALGRWPANLILDGSEEVLAGFPETKSGARNGKRSKNNSGIGTFHENERDTGNFFPSDKGSAARFFYCAKASKRDRDEGLEGFEAKFSPTMGNGIGGKEHDPETATQKRNVHPTVKPTDLMRYLCRLVTPPGGVVLDPFMGSGSTGKAAMLEGFSFIGCEMSPEYVEIARARIEHAQKQADEKPVASNQSDLFS